MGLKITIDTLEGLDPAIAALYEPSGSKFVLVLDEADQGSTAGLLRKNALLVGEVKTLKAKVAGLPALVPPKLQSQMTPREKFMTDAAKRLEALERGTPEYAAELAALESEMEPLIHADVAERMAADVARVDSLKTQLKKLLVDNEAQAITRDLAKDGCFEALLPHVRDRLVLGEPIEGAEHQYPMLVRDAKGTPAAMSLEALKDEFRGNSAFAPLVRGLSPQERATQKRLIDAALGRLPQSGNVVSRERFDLYSAKARADHVARGGSISNDDGPSAA